MGKTIEPQQVERDLFAPFNERGARLLQRIGDADFVNVGIMDSWRVLRVATHDGGDGMDFWVMFRALGWFADPQPQYTHLRKVLTWERTPDGMILRTDVPGETLALEFIDDSWELEAWKRNQESRQRFRGFNELDASHQRYLRDKIIPEWWSGQ